MARVKELQGNIEATRLFNLAEYPTPKTPGWRHMHVGDYANAHLNIQMPDYIVSGVSAGDQQHVSVQIMTPTKLQSPPPQVHKLRLLNEAYATSELRIDIAENCTLQAPLQITVLGVNPGTYLPRIRINVGTNSTANIITEYQFSKQAQCVISAVEHVYVGRHAKMQMIIDAESHHKVDQFLSHNLNLQESAQVTHMPIMYGSGLSRIEVGANLSGQEASVEMYGLSLSTNNAQLIYETKQSHTAPHTESNLEYRTILLNESNAFFRGLININKQAQRSNAYQKNLNVMLSKTAKVHTTPELEIRANDVRCTHGATSGPLDGEQLFYAKARGLIEHEAQMLLTESFALANVTRFTEKHLQRYAQKVISRVIKKAIRNI